MLEPNPRPAGAAVPDLPCGMSGAVPAALDTSHSPPRRRRSTFFERRDSLVPQMQTEDPMARQIEKAVEDHRRHLYIDELSRYYDKLTKEKEAWKCEARERRSKYHDLRDQLQAAVSGSASASIDYSVLSNEDIEFLKGKPNVTKIAESSLELHKCVTQTMNIIRKLTEMDSMVLGRCEQKVNTIQKYILENSTVDPVE